MGDWKSVTSCVIMGLVFFGTNFGILEISMTELKSYENDKIFALALFSIVAGTIATLITSSFLANIFPCALPIFHHLKTENEDVIGQEVCECKICHRKWKLTGRAYCLIAAGPEDQRKIYEEIKKI